MKENQSRPKDRGIDPRKIKQYNCYTLLCGLNLTEIKVNSSVIFEVREDSENEYYHLVTSWKSTKEEKVLYEKNI